jgi:hypothetical protein
MDLPAIQIQWEEFKVLDEVHVDYMELFGIILLTLVKDDDAKIIYYEYKTDEWGVMGS